MTCISNGDYGRRAAGMWLDLVSEKTEGTPTNTKLKDEDYRSRIYAQYVTVGIAPTNSIEALERRRPYLQRIIRQYFPEDRGAAILELGCGSGALIHFLRKAGYTNIEGFDLAPDQVVLAQQLGISDVRLGDAMETLKASANSSRDVVVAFDLIEHLTNDVLLKFTDEVSRVLRPGGRLILHTPNGESPFCARMRYWDLTHERAFTWNSIRQLLLSSGFSEVHYMEDSPTVHGLRSIIRWLLWKGLRGLLRLWLMAETGETAREAIFTQNFLVVAMRN
jgi:2-polyprenyl-3-methyl-5-hydroxy-6-metoxy-1,4-benzoquinol methylase